MREPRNPFRLRASEHIESTETFLRLFSPGVLDIWDKDSFWNGPQIIRSAPGGGKTSLLRILTAESLLTLYSLRTRDYFKDLFQKMKEIGALTDDGPIILGVLMSCAQNYAALDDLEIDDAKKKRLLLSLLNSRIVLAALQGALTLKRLRYPADLKKLTISPSEGITCLSNIKFPCSGEELYEWARSLEKDICEALDSFTSTRFLRGNAVDLRKFQGYNHV